MIEAKILTKDDDQALIKFYEELGKDNPSVLAYHYPFYRDMLQNLGVGEASYLGCWHQKELVGAMPGFIKESRLGTVYSSMPFFGPNAGILCDYNGQNVQDIHKSIISFLAGFMKKQNNPLTASIYTPFLYDGAHHYDTYLSPDYSIDKETLYLKLNKIELDSKTRYDIRKAEKSGVKIVNLSGENQIQSVFDIYKKNCEENNIPLKPFNAIAFLIKEGIKHNKVRCYLALFQEKIISALMVLWGPLTVSYYLPCVIYEYRNLQPSSLLIDYAIKDAISHGLEYWNWEASPTQDSGVFHFKKKWGSISSRYKVYVKAFADRGGIEQFNKKQIMDNFPFYFVYPFERIKNN